MSSAVYRAARKLPTYRTHRLQIAPVIDRRLQP